MSNNTEKNEHEDITVILQNYLKEKNYKKAIKCVKDKQNAKDVQKNCTELVGVVTEHLTVDNLSNDADLYNTSENLLKILASECNREEILFEILEILETSKDDDIFTSVLKALQIVLLRTTENRARSLEWSLNSVVSYIAGIEIPTVNAEEEEEAVLENDDRIRRILQLYITTLLFLEPIHESILKVPVTTFKNNGITRRNILVCFILQLMDKPLSHLKLSHFDLENKKCKSYSRQCAEKLQEILSTLLPDPFYLLGVVEQRIRWPIKKRGKVEGVFEDNPQNIFLIEDKVPILSLGTFYYLLIAEGLVSPRAPQIYTGYYIFEKTLYLVVEMIKNGNSSVQFKGILLASNLIRNLKETPLTSEDFELKIHKEFCKHLIEIIVHSNSARNRKQGTILLKDYINSFDEAGRYLALSNLFDIVQHNGLYAYLATLYKNMVAEELNLVGENELNEWYCGKYFKSFLLDRIFLMKKGTETDLMEESDLIISALNFLRFLLIRDKENKTSILDIVPEIKKGFLVPLRSALDFSKAHYKNEESLVKEGKDTNISEIEMNLEVQNGEPVPQLSKEKKLNMIACALNNFDVVESLLAIVNSYIE